MAYLGEKVINKSKVLPFLDYFFIEPTKSSLIGEKSPNLVTLPSSQSHQKLFFDKKLFRSQR